MKNTGSVRKIEHLGRLGRLVIPKALRRALKINTGDSMEIFIEEDLIILKKFKSRNACIITDEVSDVNIEYAHGLFLSPKGAEILLETLQKEK